MARSKSANSNAKPQLRIIGGRWRGRKLNFPGVEGLRPTGDRIRETLFNWLMSDLPQARVLDMFSGAGGLGLESASRGAKLVTLIERSPEAARSLRSNLKLLEADNTELIEADSLHWLQQYSGEPFDIVFIDPPFSQDLWQQSFDTLERGIRLANNAAIYVECERNRQLSVPANWHLHREKHAGNVSYQLYYRQTS